MKSIIKTYLNWLLSSKGLSAGTVKSYGVDLGQFSDFLVTLDDPVTDPKNLGPEHISQFYQFMYTSIKPSAKRSKKASSHTRRKKASALRGFLSWLVEFHEIDQAVRDAARLPRAQDILPDVLFKEELQRLWTIVDSHMTESPGRRDAALIVMLFDHGLRVSEALNIKLDDIQPREIKGKKTYWVKLQRKGGRERFIPMTDRAAWYVKHHLDGRDVATEWVFNNSKNSRSASLQLTRGGAWKRIQALGKEAGLKAPLHPHTFRHTFVVMQMEAGTSLDVIIAFMDHRDVKSLMKYWHVQNLRLLDVTDNAPSMGMEMLGVPKI